jgi:branched-chain amino acid transport system permease protein
MRDRVDRVVLARHGAFARSTRWRAWEVGLWVGAVVAAVVAPRYAPLFNEIAILALFAVSLDLVLGYAGIVSLGHAAFFGVGAYTAGLFSKFVTGDPLLGLVVASAVAGAIGLVTSPLVLRGTDLTRLMVTLGVALILFELANRFDNLTGGADGLQGVAIDPLLGRFSFGLSGVNAYGYSLAVLFLLFLVARRMVHSPFGYSLEAIRDNRTRALAIGIPVSRRLAAIYTIAAAYAGAAGALLAQTTAFVSLDVLDFHRSADVMLMVVLGGTGYLYGGILGAIVFRVMYDVLSGVTTQYWQFWLGLALVVLMLVGHERLVRPFHRVSALLRRPAATSAGMASGAEPDGGAVPPPAADPMAANAGAAEANVATRPRPAP